MPEHTIWADPGAVWCGRAPGQWAAGDCYSRPWAPDCGGVDAMRLGVSEQELGGVASVLGPPPFFPVPGPKACVHAGGCLAPRGPVMTEQHVVLVDDLRVLHETADNTAS